MVSRRKRGHQGARRRGGQGVAHTQRQGDEVVAHPAGAALSLQLARAGMGVRLVEREKAFDGRESLTIPEPVAELGDRAFRVASPAALIERLVDAASRLPTFSFHPGTRFVDVLRTGSRVSGARVADATGSHDLAADLVIGCDGRPRPAPPAPGGTRPGRRMCRKLALRPGPPGARLLGRYRWAQRGWRASTTCGSAPRRSS
jgi:hypothetical protein